MSQEPISPRRQSLNLKIIFGLSLALLAIALVTFLAFNGVSRLVDALREESKPNEKLVLLNDIMADLGEAGSSVRTYTITNEAEYLIPYQEAVGTINDKMNELYALTSNEEQLQRLDSINRLISDKYIVLNQMLYLSQNDQVKNVLDKIIIEIGEREEMAKTEAEKLKFSTLKELFRPKKEKDEIIDKPVEELATIQKMVNELRQEELKKTEEIKKKELNLTKYDFTIMSRIRAVVDEMAVAEAASAMTRAQNAARLAKYTTAIITVASIAAFILLLSMAYLILSFISKTIAYNKQLKEAKEKAEKLSEAKEDFLATMSHEIRTPMNAILGFSEQLEKTELNKKQQTYINTIRHSTEHLLVVVNDILDQAKLNSGKFVFEQVGFRPAQLISNVYDAFRINAKAKNLRFEFSVDEKMPLVLKGDPHRLKQILFNLVSNAIKFTEEGEVRIAAFAEEKDNKKVELRIEVSDTGIGISPEKIDKIFEGFYQSDSSNTRKFGGTGLGLAITKKLVELQAGTLNVTSQKDTGSIFSITIPYLTGSERDLEESISVPQDPAGILGDLRVLVVDDEDYNRLLLDAILTRWGVKITLCESGRKAIEELEKNDHDLILMDVRMPEFSGLDATRYIRNKMSGSKAETPIIALTAASSEEDIRKCKGAGMNDFLSKPFREAELFEKISSVMHIENKMMHNSQEKVQTISINEKKYDLTELRHLSNGDDNFVNEMINVYIENTRSGMSKMKDALEKNNWEKVGLYAHRLAAPSRHLSMKSVVKLLKEIENNTMNNTKLEGVADLIQKLDHELEIILEQLAGELKVKV